MCWVDWHQVTEALSRKMDSLPQVDVYCFGSFFFFAVSPVDNAQDISCGDREGFGLARCARVFHRALLCYHHCAKAACVETPLPE